MFNMNSNNTYNGLDMNLIKDFKKACVTYGPVSPFHRENLASWSNDAGWIPCDFHIVAKMILSSAEFLQWKMCSSDEAHERVTALGQQGNGGAVSYEMLNGTGAWLSQTHQVKNIPSSALPYVHVVALAAWDKINMGAEYQGSYVKLQQGRTEPYSDFIGRFKESIKNR
jgi:hypothetical protein